jgi:hypothetical protein
VENGYNTDLGLNVLYWQDWLTEYKSDALVYRDMDEETIEKGLEHENNLLVEIEARKFSDSPGIDGNKCLQDVIRAIGADITLGGLAIKVSLTGNEKDVETEGKTVVRTLVKFNVLYRNPRFNPL